MRRRVEHWERFGLVFLIHRVFFLLTSRGDNLEKVEELVVKHTSFVYKLREC